MLNGLKLIDAFLVKRAIDLGVGVQDNIRCC